MVRLTQDEVHELLINGSSTSTANREFRHETADGLARYRFRSGHGTSIRMVKKTNLIIKTIAGNIVSFLQQKFSTRENPSLSQELRLQNQNLVQSLSLFEEKNEELERINKELLDLKLKLEQSNLDLQERTAELQDALLSLGDRTTELESQNRRFSAVLQQMSEGVVITDRSGVVTTLNSQALKLFASQEEEIVGKAKYDWFHFLEKFKDPEFEDWNQVINNLDQQPTAIHNLKLLITDPDMLQNRISCRIFQYWMEIIK